MEPIDTDLLEKSIVNPFYAITLHEYLFEPHEIRESKEDWVARNMELLNENGVDAWLEQLLKVLTSDKKPLMQELVNPYKAINFSERLHGEHEPLVSLEQWIEANKNMMAEIGAGQWLWRLLEVLETGGPA